MNKKTSEIESVNVHAWVETVNGIEYCDASNHTPHGWNVHERTVTNARGIFEIIFDQDYTTKEQALAAAEIRAAMHNVPLIEY